MTFPKFVHEPVIPVVTFGKWDVTFIRDFHPEIRDAVDAAFAVDTCEGMTGEERAEWIMGIRAE